MIQRTLQTVIAKYIGKGKAILLVGARQVGKSTLFRLLTDSMASPVLWLNCDQSTTQTLLTNPSLMDLRMLIATNKTIVIDEAQRVENIGLTLKLITDNFPEVQLLVIGSSSLGLHDRLNEPLTGRKIEYFLFPISTEEIYRAEGVIAVKERLPKRLIYGSYPDVLYGALPQEKALRELAESYLYKDVLEIEGLRKPAVLQKLLTALALQVGSEVSYNELSRTVGIDSKTIEKYIDILEKCFIVFRLNSYSRNLRTELTKGKKIYFYDLGIRNAILSNFSPIDMRMDIGALWENFFIVERMKYNHYADRAVNTYFWRTSDKQEIDYIEESNGELHLFEMKWNAKKQNTKIPNQFLNTYHPAHSDIITPDNYLQFLITM
ncbi:MAG: ATP-binding protein [Paludibacteraceae bacterium]|nr:ATP-binding protein [Bacteroidales bacterium]MDY4149462.1 ATP-binding protein [Paludibacteraceae bacterium]